MRTERGQIRPARLYPMALHDIWPCMSLRSLVATLIAVALMFSPLVMKSGSAMAMAPAADHHAQMTQDGHCGEQPVKDHDKSVDTSCCAAMCTAVAVHPIAPAEAAIQTSSSERPSIAQFRHGFLAELPTPPPRLA